MGRSQTARDREATNSCDAQTGVFDDECGGSQ
jgi:hypothetical protein